MVWEPTFASRADGSTRRHDGHDGDKQGFERIPVNFATAVIFVPAAGPRRLSEGRSL